MLLVMMYHFVEEAKHSNSILMLKDHLEYIENRYDIVLPGDPVSLKKLSVCLTFDDGLFSFYYYIFPILKRLKIRALLSVPVKYILNTTSVSSDIRLSLPYYEAMREDVYKDKAPFCTWEELSEMVASGYVEVASHSYSHCNLTFPGINVYKEVVLSKKILEDHIAQNVSTFVYPFGRVSPSLQKTVLDNYPYTMRIGSALNRTWGGKMFRVVGDGLKSPCQPFSALRLLHYHMKYVVNSCR